MSVKIVMLSMNAPRVMTATLPPRAMIARIDGMRRRGVVRPPPPAVPFLLPLLPLIVAWTLPRGEGLRHPLAVMIAAGFSIAADVTRAMIARRVRLAAGFSIAADVTRSIRAIRTVTARIDGIHRRGVARLLLRARTSPPPPLPQIVDCHLHPEEGLRPLLLAKSAASELSSSTALAVMGGVLTTREVTVKTAIHPWTTTRVRTAARDSTAVVATQAMTAWIGDTRRQGVVRPLPRAATWLVDPLPQIAACLVRPGEGFRLLPLATRAVSAKILASSTTAMPARIALSFSIVVLAMGAMAARSGATRRRVAVCPPPLLEARVFLGELPMAMTPTRVTVSTRQPHSGVRHLQDLRACREIAMFTEVVARPCLRGGLKIARAVS